MKKSDAEWKKDLNPETYEILRNKGTERAFSGKYYAHKEDGTYQCAGCGEALFDSNTKYNSGCGWPSFYAANSKDVVNESLDKSHGMIRTEITCSNCGGHLGHLFPDGPKPTGMRYCINSASLKFEKK